VLPNLWLTASEPSIKLKYTLGLIVSLGYVKEQYLASYLRQVKCSKKTSSGEWENLNELFRIL